MERDIKLTVVVDKRAGTLRVYAPVEIADRCEVTLVPAESGPAAGELHPADGFFADLAAAELEEQRVVLEARL